MSKEVPKMRLITPAILSERFKIICSLAKQVIRYFRDQKMIIALDAQHKQLPLFTGSEVKEIKA